jgi:hypothetical protein
LESLKRFNDKAIAKSERANKKIETTLNMSSSCIINPLNMSMMRGTNTSFFNPSSGSNKINKVKELKKKL